MATTTTTTTENEIELQPLPNAQVADFSFAPGQNVPVVQAKQRWNDPSINKWRILATFVSFTIVGASDGVYGTLVPSIRSDFKLSNTVVSLIFMTPFFGYTIATFFVNKLHMTFGQRGIAVIGPLCHLIPFIAMAVHPPYPVYLVAYIFVGLANGLIDAAWNAWIGDMANANTLMGFLHAFYGLGATVSPTIATSMINAKLGWWMFYWTLAGGSVLEFIVNASLFWPENAQKFRENNKKEPGSEGGSRTKAAVMNKTTWMIALFLFAYMGIEVSISGWIVDFLVSERHGTPLESGFIPTGFWAGVTVGRLTLGYVNEKLGERIAVATYLVICIGWQLVLWLVPKFVVSAVAVAFLGYFTGPLFPAAIVVAAKLLPKHLHTAGIGFASAFAGAGAAILPFLAGAIAEPYGVKSLQPFILALLVAITVFWIVLPREKKTVHN